MITQVIMATGRRSLNSYVCSKDKITRVFNGDMIALHECERCISAWFQMPTYACSNTCVCVEVPRARSTTTVYCCSVYQARMTLHLIQKTYNRTARLRLHTIQRTCDTLLDYGK